MPNLPGISHERAVRAFQKAGFWIARVGKHTTMTNGERIIAYLDDEDITQALIYAEQTGPV